jgi:hypothetical protein
MSNYQESEVRGYLAAPSEFWELTPRQRGLICNGGGPKKFGWLVPDTMWGLSMTDCFDIHDYDYFIQTPRVLADYRLRRNLIDKIKDYGGWLMKLRLLRARTYFKLVHYFGGVFY